MSMQSLNPVQSNNPSSMSMQSLNPVQSNNPSSMTMQSLNPVQNYEITINGVSYPVNYSTKQQVSFTNKNNKGDVIATGIGSLYRRKNIGNNNNKKSYIIVPDNSTIKPFVSKNINGNSFSVIENTNNNTNNNTNIHFGNSTEFLPGTSPIEQESQFSSGTIPIEQYTNAKGKNISVGNRITYRSTPQNTKGRKGTFKGVQNGIYQYTPNGSSEVYEATQSQIYKK
jgi:hypothetical protein